MMEGLILGQVIDRSTSTGAEHISVALNHVEVRQEMAAERGLRAGAGRLPVQNLEGAGPFTRATHVRAITDGGGYFVLGFRFDPLRMGMAVDSPRYQINLQALVRVGAYPTARLLDRHTGDFAVVVSLRNVASGRFPDLRNPADSATIKSITKLAMQIRHEVMTRRVPNSTSPAHLRNLRLPNMFLTPSRPSPEMYALLGAAQIRVAVPSGIMGWD